eukprot:14892730-Ditylum_brightwellii.AAC.1
MALTRTTPAGSASTANAATPAAAPPTALAYTNQIWDGALSAATGFVAKMFAKSTIAEQKQLTKAFFTFLSNSTKSLL